MLNKNAYGVVKSSIDYYQNNRNTIEELYKSEKYFLEPLFNKVKTVLDIGTAAGGLSSVCYKINPLLIYTGIDISPELISLAKKEYPNSHFKFYDGKIIPYTKSSFDLVFSLGVLHHLSHWKSIITQMLSISKDYVVFDLRLTRKKTLNNPKKYYQKLTLNNIWDGKTKLNYIVLNVDEVYRFIKNLIKEDYSCEVFGYSVVPNKSCGVRIPYNEIYSCSFCITKNKSKPVFIDNVCW